MYGEFGNMMGGYGWFGWGFTWLFCVAIGAFVFGIVFWWTYKLIVEDNKRGKK